MNYEIHRSSKACKIREERREEMKELIYNHAKINDKVDVESRREFIERVKIRIDDDELTEVQIGSDFTYLNSVIILLGNLVLVQSEYPTLLLQYLEKINDCIIVPGKIKLDLTVEDITANFPSALIGNVELAYTTNIKTLATITVCIAEEDVPKFLPGLHSKAVEFVKRRSSINLANLKLARVESGLVLLSETTTHFYNLAVVRHLLKNLY